MRIKLEDAVHTEKLMPVQIRPALFASQCDACRKVFHMKPFCNDGRLGELEGTFEKCPDDPETGRGLGNGFYATACSFACAHELFANGGWRKIARYKPYVDADIQLVRAELKITSFVRDEAQLRKEWSEIT